MVQYAPGPIARDRKPQPTLEEIQTSRKIAEAMMREGSSYEPVGHWTQGAARVAQALVGSMRDSQANSQQKGLEGDANEALMGLYQPPSVTGGMPPIPSSAMKPEPQMSQEEASVGRFANPNVAPSPVAAALDPSLVQAVKGFEGYTPKSQWDYKQHSVGYGTRGKPGEVIDQAEAERRLGDELTKAQNIVQQFAPGAPDGVKKALTSLTYNAGADWTSSGLGAAVKRGDWQEAQRIFLQYNKAGGQTLPGLVNRRQQEAQWFNQQPQAQPAMALGGPQQAAQAQPQQPQQMPIQMADASQGQGMTRETLERMLANPLTRDAAQKMLIEQADPYRQAQIQKMQRDAQSGGEQPANVREYEYFKNLPSDEARQKYLAVKRAQQNMDLGDRYGVADQLNPGQLSGEVQKNLRAAEFDKGRGKDDADFVAKIPQVMGAYKSFAQKTDNVLGVIDRAIGSVGANTTGWGAILANMPETEARALQGDLNTIKANLAFAELESMRNNSPTGGALGSITERELDLLASVQASLDQLQAGARVKENLGLIKSNMSEIKRLRGEGYSRDLQRYRTLMPEQGGGGQQPAQGGGATHRWNSQTQRLEPIGGR